MKKLARVIFCLAAATWVTGCASSGSYFADRGRDFMDVFTLSVGTGVGGKVRAGPVGGGLVLDKSLVGLRGGDTFVADFEPGRKGPQDIDAAVVCLGWERFGATETTEARHKDYDGKTCCHLTGDVPTPFIYTLDPDAGERARCPSFYTQCEAVAGFGLTIRAGFNPGELVDLLLGFIGVDIYGDDLEARRRRETTAKRRLDDDAGTGQ